MVKAIIFSAKYDLLAEEDKAAVRAALEELPIKERVIVMMKHFSGYTDSEAAEVCSCTVWKFRQMHAQTLHHIHNGLKNRGVVVCGGLSTIVGGGIQDIINSGCEKTVAAISQAHSHGTAFAAS